MDSVSIVRRMHEHRVWADRGVSEAALPLSIEQLSREFPIGQGTVWKSLCHMWGAEYVWLEALMGNESAVPLGDDPRRIPGNQQGTDAVTNMAELGQRWNTLHHRWDAWLAQLTDDRLMTPVWRASAMVSPPRRVETACIDVLIHVCTHAHWTAAQTVNMLRSLGVDSLPNVMHISMARQQLGQY